MRSFIAYVGLFFVLVLGATTGTILYKSVTHEERIKYIWIVIQDESGRIWQASDAELTRDGIILIYPNSTVRLIGSLTIIKTKKQKLEGTNINKT